jgi:CHAD domain-containing protein
MTHRRTHQTKTVHSLHDATLSLIDGAIETLSSRHDDAAVHAARKAAKRIRAALRLMRGCLGAAAYHRENRRVRDAAKPLAAVRDAFMLRRILRKMPSRSSALEGGLKLEYRRERQAFSGQGLQVALVQLRATRQHLVELRPMAPEAASAVEGVGNTYRAGRKALVKAKSLDDGALHEWCKQAKYLLNELEILRAVFGVDLRKLRRRADRLAVILGDDHDLSVLSVKLRRYDVTAPRLAKHVEKLRRRLHRRAEKQGKKLYRLPAKAIKATIAAHFLKPR